MTNYWSQINTERYRNPHIAQTAKDYDMTYNQVLHISKYYPEGDFYTMLERFIEDRKRKAEGEKACQQNSI